MRLAGQTIYLIGSPQQLGEILFGQTGALKGGKKGKSGQYSTDVTAMLEDLCRTGRRRLPDKVS